MMEVYFVIAVLHCISLLAKFQLINNFSFLITQLEAFPGKTLSELADMFVNAIKSGSLRNSK